MQICRGEEYKPEGIPNYQEGNVFLLRVAQNLLAIGLDHFSVGNGNRPPIIVFLFMLEYDFGHCWSQRHTRTA